MNTPSCLSQWTRTSSYSWKHPTRNYHVNYANLESGTVWDCWYGKTGKGSVCEQIDGGLETALRAVNACKRHAGAV